MRKDEITLSRIYDLNRKLRAEALINQGYDTVEKIQSASISDLIKTKGINENVARIRSLEL